MHQDTLPAWLVLWFIVEHRCAMFTSVWARNEGDEGVIKMREAREARAMADHRGFRHDPRTRNSAVYGTFGDRKETDARAFCIAEENRVTRKRHEPRGEGGWSTW